MSVDLDKLKSYRISARRNFKGTPFTPLMTKESKLQIERKVVEVLGELYGSYTQFAKMEESQKEWLRGVGICVEKESEHDAAGINDDWPIGRGVFIHE